MNISVLRPHSSPGPGHGGPHQQRRSEPLQMQPTANEENAARGRDPSASPPPAKEAQVLERERPPMRPPAPPVEFLLFPLTFLLES